MLNSILQNKFVKEYLLDFDPVRAAKISGYKLDDLQYARIENMQPYFQTIFLDEIEKRLEEFDIKTIQLVNELGRYIRELFNVANSTEVKVRVNNANRALEIIGTHYGYFEYKH